MSCHGPGQMAGQLGRVGAGGARSRRCAGHGRAGQPRDAPQHVLAPPLAVCLPSLVRQRRTPPLRAAVQGGWCGQGMSDNLHLCMRQWMHGMHGAGLASPWSPATAPAALHSPCCGRCLRPPRPRPRSPYAASTAPPADCLCSGRDGLANRRRPAPAPPLQPPATAAGRTPMAAPRPVQCGPPCRLLHVWRRGFGSSSERRAATAAAAGGPGCTAADWRSSAAHLDR